MSMPILEKLQSDVTRHASTYAAARERIPALAAYPALNAIVATLRPAAGGKLTEDAARSELLSAIVMEAQRSQHPLWTSLLLVAFTPMVRRIRRQAIPCRGDTTDDVDQRVLGAFVEAVRKASPAHVALGLRWATQRGAWTAREAELREERVEGPTTSGLDEDAEPVWFDGDSFEVVEVEEPALNGCENPFAQEDAMLERITARRIARELEAKGKGELARTEQRRAVRRLRVRHQRDAA